MQYSVVVCFQSIKGVLRKALVSFHSVPVKSCLSAIGSIFCDTRCVSKRTLNAVLSLFL